MKASNSSAAQANNITFLRLLMAVLVLLSHAPELMDGNRGRELLTRLFGTFSFGEIGLYGFFLLSGYLITQSWLRRPDAVLFLRNRLLRVYPAFIAATLVCAFILGPLAADPMAYIAAFDPLLFLKHMLLLKQPGIPAVFAGTPYPSINGAMWSISYEFLCYLTLLALGMAGLVKRRYPMLLLGAGAWLLLFYPAAADALMPKIFFSIHRNVFLRALCMFCAGSCFFLFRDVIRYTPKGAVMAAAAFLTGLCYDKTAFLAMMSFGAYLLFWIAFTDIPLLRRYPRGYDISYGVYLYGWPTQKLLIWYGVSTSPWMIFLLSLGLCCLAGALSWHYIEKKCLRVSAIF